MKSHAARGLFHLHPVLFECLLFCRIHAAGPVRIHRPFFFGPGPLKGILGILGNTDGGCRQRGEGGGSTVLRYTCPAVRPRYKICKKYSKKNSITVTSPQPQSSTIIKPPIAIQRPPKMDIYIYKKKLQKDNPKILRIATAVNRTRTSTLEGWNPNHWTTEADLFLMYCAGLLWIINDTSDGK
jgi:hypothetical protein